MKILNVAITTLALAFGTMSASAELLSVTSVQPAEGIVAEVGTPLLNFDAIPTPNPDCQDYAVMMFEGKIISTISTSESNRLQRFIQQPDNSVRLVFTTKRYTDPGVYTVIVPEGYLTFNNGKDQNAAYEFSYTILDSKSVIFEPAGGYYQDVPNVIKLTIPGVKEIIDNHQAYNSDTGLGGMPYLLPTDIKQTDPVIEGNTLTWTFASKPYTSSGEYQLRVSAGALTLVMEDGSTIPNPEYKVYYRKSIITMPVLNILEGKDNNEVYEIGDLSLTLEDGTFASFMRMPSIYSVNKYGEQDSRIFSYDLATYPVSGQHTITFTSQLSSPYSVPGHYLFMIGKSSFSAKGPYNDKEYLGGGDEEIVEVWNNVDLMYRVRIVPSPAEVITTAPSATSELSEVPLIFPNAKEIEFPFTPAEEAPSIRDRFWREVKGYDISFEIVNPTADEQEYPTSAALTAANGGPCMAVARINPPLTASKAATYSICIPRGSFICDIEDSFELIHEVTIDPNLTGIQAPQVAPEDGKEVADKFTVVTPMGVVVLKDASVSELFELPAGLYIINGKATMLR